MIRQRRAASIAASERIHALYHCSPGSSNTSVSSPPYIPPIMIPSYDDIPERKKHSWDDVKTDPIMDYLGSVQYIKHILDRANVPDSQQNTEMYYTAITHLLLHPGVLMYSDLRLLICKRMDQMEDTIRMQQETYDGYETLDRLVDLHQIGSQIHHAAFRKTFLDHLAQLHTIHEQYTAFMKRTELLHVMGLLRNVIKML